MAILPGVSEFSMGIHRYEVWFDAKKAEKARRTQLAFTYMTYILTFGWAIYPLGYLYGEGVFGDEDLDMLNIVYNIADVVNKTAFGMMIQVCCHRHCCRIRKIKSSRCPPPTKGRLQNAQVLILI